MSEVWYIGADGYPTCTEFVPMPSAVLTQPIPNTVWQIPTDGGYPFITLFPEMLPDAVITTDWYIESAGDYPTKSMYPEEIAVWTEPIPTILWEIEGTYPQKEAYVEEINQPYTPPYPASMWYINADTGYPDKSVYPDELVADYKGAFEGNANLTQVHIPRTCRVIGPKAFAGTSLTEVVISKACEYSASSFPEDCKIYFWEDMDDPSAPTSGTEDYNVVEVHGYNSYRITTVYAHDEESTVSEIP